MNTLINDQDAQIVNDNHDNEIEHSLSDHREELEEMKQLRKEVRVLGQYIRNLVYLTYPTQREVMKRDREKKLERIKEIQKIRHKRAQRKYDQGNGKEKNKLRAKKYWQNKKKNENL